MNKSALPENFRRNTKFLLFRSIWFRALLRLALLLAVLIVPQVVRALEWHAVVGAQSSDKGHQAFAFLPNEIWIHENDRITWRFNVDEIHTVTFLNATDPRPDFSVGLPGFSSNPATFDGAKSVTTAPLVNGATFTVIFPKTGNFKLVCLVHENMTGAVHVLDASQTLPHDQDFYDRQAADQGRDLLSDRDGRCDAACRQHDDHASHHSHDAHLVTVGVGEISATAGGSQTLSVLRFIDDNICIHRGQTVEWDNHDPVTPHTVTFGPEPNNPVPPINVSVDADGALHAIISSNADSANSGLIVAPPQERFGLPESPLSVTRFRVTFPNTGVFPYICALHNDLGMKGTVTVFP